jgi:O-succinylbenzoate synthase
MTDEAERIKEGILVQKTRNDQTYAQIATVAGFSTETLRRRLNGDQPWKHEELHKLAAAWGVTIQQLEAGFGDNHTSVSTDP